MSDTGNPNFFKVFQGKYQLSTGEEVMLSCINTVQFMDDLAADDAGLLTVLPEECRPAQKVALPVVADGIVSVVEIDADGNVTGTPGKLHYMNGISFNISGRYY